MIHELPAYSYSDNTIKEHNQKLYVKIKDIDKNHHSNQYDNLSLMDELLLRLKEKDKPIKITPYYDKAYVNEYYGRGDDIHRKPRNHKTVFVKNTSNADKIMNFLEKLNDIETYADFARFEREYNQFIHNMLLNNAEYQKYVKSKYNHIKNYPNESLVYQLLLNENNLCLTSQWLFDLQPFERMCFNEFSSMINSNKNAVYDRFFIYELGLNKMDEEQSILNRVLNHESSADMNFVNFQIFNHYFKEKYGKDIFEKMDRLSNLYRNIQSEMFNVAKNMKIVYRQGLNNYDDYCKFYENHQKSMEDENIKMLSMDEFNDVFSEDRFKQALSLLKQSHFSLKNIYEHHDELNYTIMLKNEEILLFEKVKKEILKEVPELLIIIDDDFKNNIVEQEVSIVFSEKMPFKILEHDKNHYVMKKVIETKDNQVIIDDENRRKIEVSDFENTKDYHSKCDFYFPYLKKDKNLVLNDLRANLTSYNNGLFDYSSSGLYFNKNAVVEFNVKNNGMKQYQLSTLVKISNPSFIYVETSSSSCKGFSQIAYNAMVDFAEQNNMIVCRNIDNMTNIGSIRLINKLNHATKHNPNALLIDYAEDYFESFSNVNNLHNQLHEIEVHEVEYDKMILKMNDVMINEFKKIMCGETEPNFLKMNYNDMFVSAVVSHLGEIYQLDLNANKMMTNEQYKEIKDLYEKGYKLYLANHQEEMSHVIDIMSKINQNLTFNEDEEEWHYPDKYDDFFDENETLFNLFVEEYGSDKIKLLEKFYKENILDKNNNTIKKYLEEKVDEIENKIENKEINDLKEKVNQYKKKIKQLKNQLN